MLRRRFGTSMTATLALIGVITVETAFIEFTTKVGSWEAGAIETMPRAVADGYVAAGQAKPSDQTAHLRASLQADQTRQIAGLEERLLKALKPETSGNVERGRLKPPGAGGAEIERIENGDRLDPAKLKKEERWYHAGQMVRAVLCAQATDTPPEDRDWGRSLLHNLYCQKKRVEYKVNEGDGDRDIARYSDNVGVTRTGTDSVSGGTTYGFLVRPEWSDSLFRIPIEESVIEPYAFDVPVGQALEFNMPALDQYTTPTAGQSAAYAGFQLSRKGEITARSPSDGKVNEINYKITDLTAYTTYSRDLDADAFIRIGSLIQQVLGQAFQWKKDYEFMQGNGVGMPLGILNGGALAANLQASILNVDRFAANTITYEDTVNMMQQIHPAYWKEMYWITNSAQTLSQLVSIKDDAGNRVFLPNSLVGQWMTPALMGEGKPYNNLTYQAQGMMQGKPVLFSEKLPQLGSTGDLILTNPRYAYGVATRAGVEMAMSEHFLFSTDQIAMRWKLRNDAKPLLRGPYIQSDGGKTSGNSKTSWCSVLAAHT
jgi:HK97 family phage major capsid protein